MGEVINECERDLKRQRGGGTWKRVGEGKAADGIE